MSEVERQVATLSGQCHSHDEKLGQLAALLQKLQARVDQADGSSEGGSPPVRSVGRGAASQGGWCWRVPGLHSDAREFSGKEQEGPVVGCCGECIGRRSGAPDTPEEKPHLRTGWGRQRGLWVSPRREGRLQLDTWLSLACVLFREWIEHNCMKSYCR